MSLPTLFSYQPPPPPPPAEETTHFWLRQRLRFLQHADGLSSTNINPGSMHTKEHSRLPHHHVRNPYQGRLGSRSKQVPHSLFLFFFGYYCMILFISLLHCPLRIAPGLRLPHDTCALLHWYRTILSNNFCTGLSTYHAVRLPSILANGPCFYSLLPTVVCRHHSELRLGRLAGSRRVLGSRWVRGSAYSPHPTYICP